MSVVVAAAALHTVAAGALGRPSAHVPAIQESRLMAHPPPMLCE